MLRWSGAAGMMAVGAVVLEACAPAPPGTPGADANGLFLREGFTSRVVARAGETVAGVEYRVFPDGAATFPDAAVPGGWYYVVNHEVPGGGGGVTSLRFDPEGNIVGARAVLSGTTQNCAGGGTPWGTWLSGEEYDGGWIWEVDPTGTTPPVARTALGTFAHEAAAVAADGKVYLTEDRGNGCLYRFTPDAPGDLSTGLLEVACGPAAPGTVTWQPVPDPSAASASTRTQVPAALHFDGGEGIDTLGSSVLFTTKGDNRLWEYRTDTAALTIRYQGGGSSVLSGVDNVWVDEASGAVLVGEDGGTMEVVAVRPDNTADWVVRVDGHEGSEITGPCFSPDGQRLYFSSQRGPVGLLGLPTGVTYEVTGPWDALLGRS